MKSKDSVTPKTTLQSLSKIPGFPGLYRHENGSYYGKKKIRGIKKVVALTTPEGQNISDRKWAEKAFKAWVEKLENPAPANAQMPFGDLLQKLKDSLKGKSEATQDKMDWVRRGFEMDYPEFLRKPIESIKPSDISDFLGRRSKKLGALAYNDMSRIVKNAFELALHDGDISETPYDKVPKSIRRKKANRAPAQVPTVEQCQAICDHVRSRPFSDTAERSADMLEFMHKAALGTAECVYADWQKVNWQGGYIEVKRQKTGAYFRVPIYDHLKPFLLDLHERQGSPASGPLFSILSPKQALYNACTRLGFPAYSPIDFRKARITWFLRKGVAAEAIAKWQGHRDNGVLIRRTYSWVISDSDNAYEQEQLSKLKA